MAGGYVRGKPAMMVSSSASHLPGPVKCSEKAYYQCAIVAPHSFSGKNFICDTCTCHIFVMLPAHSLHAAHNGHLRPLMDSDHVMDNTWQCTSQNPELCSVSMLSGWGTQAVSAPMLITTLIAKTMVYHGICNITVLFFFFSAPF